MSKKHNQEYNREIALIKAYTNLSKNLFKKIKECTKETGIKQNHFQYKVKLSHVTFFRRMKSCVDWKPSEVMTIIKEIEKINILKEESISVSKKYNREKSLISAYLYLSENISKKIKKCTDQTGIKSSYFQNKVGLSPITFLKRMKFANWKISEIMTIIKEIEKINILRK